MRILITGINCALGTAVADSLAGHDVIGLGRAPHSLYETIVCDLRHELPPLPTVDVCLHMAFITDPKYCAENHFEAQRVNVAATAELAKAAPRFILASTGYVYGFQDGPLDEEMPLAPHDAYSAMKLAAEEIANRHPNSAVLRYFFPFGPATKPGGIINRLIQRVEANDEIDVHDDDRPRTNPIYISDLARATRLFCLENHCGTFNVGGDEALSIKEMAALIGKLSGKNPRFRPTGKKIGNMVGSTNKLERLFRPTVSFASGLATTIAGIKKSQWIEKEKCA